MWAKFNKFSTEEWAIGDERETWVKIEGYCDLEQLAAISKALMNSETQFEIVVKKTAEAIGDQSAYCGHTFIIKNAPDLQCIARKGHDGGHVLPR